MTILCVDDDNVKEILPRIKRRFITYGLSEEADYRVTDISFEGAGSRFSLFYRDTFLGFISLNVPGLYNVCNAVAAIAVARELDLDPAKVNPNGSGISLGHPVGATGAIITVKALYELHRIGGRYALVTMCIGGGQGIAAIFERA